MSRQSIRWTSLAIIWTLVPGSVLLDGWEALAALAAGGLAAWAGVANENTWTD